LRHYFRMNRIIYIFIYIFLLSLPILAQHPRYPQRTPKDIAHKQTEMLVRELNITDSLLRDTLFHLHLKYALLRKETNTRSEILLHMQQIINELQNILSPEQFAVFMNRQVQTTPRYPQAQHNRLIHCHHGDSLQHLEQEEEHMPPLPPKHQLQDHQ